MTKIKKKYFILCCASALIFILSACGIFDNSSEHLHKLLCDLMGYTPNQGYAFGPLWFFHLNSNLGAMASKEILFIITIGFSTLLYLYNYKNSLKIFLITILGGIIIFVLVKYVSNNNLVLLDFLGINNEDENFPSGHAYTASLLYTTIYFSINKFIPDDRRRNFSKFFFLIIIFLVGTSRILGGNHSLSEVLGGWSLGIMWVFFMQILGHLEIYFKQYRNNQLRY